MCDVSPSKTLVRSTNLIDLHCPLPLTVPDQVIYQFCWYFQGEVREGMRLHHELYGVVAQFAFVDQTAALELACTFTAKGGCVVISVDSASTTRRVWLNLRNWNLIKQPDERCEVSPIPVMR